MTRRLPVFSAKTEELAHRPRRMEETEPHRNELRTKDAPTGRKKASPIAAFAGGFQNVGGISDGVEVPFAAGQFVIAAGLRVRPNALGATGMIAVVMILVDGRDLARNIDNIGAEVARLPNEVVIPPDAPDDERRNLGIEAAGEGEIVDRIGAAANSFLEGELAETISGTGPVEIDGLRDVHIPATADHEKSVVDGLHALEGAAELRQKDDVAIEVAEEIVARDFLCAGEHEIEALGAEFIALHKRLVAQAELAGNFGGAGIIAEENDFHMGMEELPALERISLEDGALIPERLCGSEKREHLSLSTVLLQGKTRKGDKGRGKIPPHPSVAWERVRKCLIAKGLRLRSCAKECGRM